MPFQRIQLGWTPPPAPPRFGVRASQWLGERWRLLPESARTLIGYSGWGLVSAQLWTQRLGPSLESLHFHAPNIPLSLSMGAAMLYVAYSTYGGARSPLWHRFLNYFGVELQNPAPPAPEPLDLTKVERAHVSAHLAKELKIHGIDPGVLKRYPETMRELEDAVLRLDWHRGGHSQTLGENPAGSDRRIFYLFSGLQGDPHADQNRRDLAVLVEMCAYRLKFMDGAEALRLGDVAIVDRNLFGLAVELRNLEKRWTQAGIGLPFSAERRIGELRWAFACRALDALEAYTQGGVSLFSTQGPWVSAIDPSLFSFRTTSYREDFSGQLDNYIQNLLIEHLNQVFKGNKKVIKISADNPFCQALRAKAELYLRAVDPALREQIDWSQAQVLTEALRWHLAHDPKFTEAIDAYNYYRTPPPENLSAAEPPASFPIASIAASDFPRLDPKGYRQHRSEHPLRDHIQDLVAQTLRRLWGEGKPKIHTDQILPICRALEAKARRYLGGLDPSQIDFPNSRILNDKLQAHLANDPEIVSKLEAYLQTHKSQATVDFESQVRDGVHYASEFLAREFHGKPAELRWLGEIQMRLRAMEAVRVRG